MKKILPISYPPITTYTGYASPLAIMYGHEETHEWIFSHFVQMCAIQIEVNDFDHYNDTEGYLPAFFDDIDNRRIMYSMSDGMLIDRDKWSPLAFF